LLTRIWVDTDGEHILINTVEDFPKIRNVARDPRVAVNLTEPDDVRRSCRARGRLIATTIFCAVANIDMISLKHLGLPHPNFRGRRRPHPGDHRRRLRPPTGRLTPNEPLMTGDRLPTYKSRKGFYP